MKTIFIVNPKAGQGENIDSLIADINNTVAETGADATVYLTTAIGDAQRFVQDYVSQTGAARFIACGGDGTLNEVLNGAMDCAEAEIGVIPLGTGNDFCRNFDASLDFHDIKKQLCGRIEKCDAIRYKTTVEGTVYQGYCVNMANIGFDCNVADMTAQMKQKPFVSGSVAYFLSILVCMIKKKGADLLIEIDGEAVHEGRLLLTSVANGSYCGGGIKSNPIALVTDGLLNVNIIKNIKRVQFIPLLPHYMDGTILEVKNIDRLLLNKNCKKITVTPRNGVIRLCIDGEIMSAGKTEFEVIHNAFNFVTPGETIDIIARGKKIMEEHKELFDRLK